MRLLMAIVLCFVCLQNIDAGSIKNRNNQLDAEARNFLRNLYYLRNIEMMSNKSPYEFHKRETVKEGKSWSEIMKNILSPSKMYGRKQQWDITYGK